MGAIHYVNHAKIDYIPVLDYLMVITHFLVARGVSDIWCAIKIGQWSTNDVIKDILTLHNIVAYQR